MKRFFWYSTILIFLLSACSPSGTGFECQEGICIHIEYSGPVQALEPMPFTISVKTEKDVPRLGVSVYGDLSITILDIEKKPDIAELAYQDDRSLDWRIDTIGGELYTFTGHVLLDKPTATYGLNSYGLIVAASKQAGFRVTDSISIYLDSEGNQVDPETVKLLSETQEFVPFETGIIIFPTYTPYPTIRIPTATATPSAKLTLPSYPPPEENVGIGAGSKSEPALTPTLAAYPAP